MGNPPAEVADDSPLAILPCHRNCGYRHQICGFRRRNCGLCRTICGCCHANCGFATGTADSEEKAIDEGNQSCGLGTKALSIILTTAS